MKLGRMIGFLFPSNRLFVLRSLMAYFVSRQPEKMETEKNIEISSSNKKILALEI